MFSLTTMTGLTRTCERSTWGRLAITITDHEAGRLYRDGRMTERLGAGRHVRWGRLQVVAIDLRQRSDAITGQELITKDRNPVKVSAVLIWSVSDVDRLLTVADPVTGVHQAGQLALRALVSSTDLEVLMSNDQTLATRLAELVAPLTAPLGIAVHSAMILDVMLSAELKRAYADLVKARQEGLAALERARGEQAGLRALANAARMLKDQPELAQLKLLQSIASVSTNGRTTLVLGDGAGGVRLTGGATATTPGS